VLVAVIVVAVVGILELVVVAPACNTYVVIYLFKVKSKKLIRQSLQKHSAGLIEVVKKY